MEQGGYEAAVSAEESDMMVLLLGDQYIANEKEQEATTAMTPMFWPYDADFNLCFTDINCNAYSWPQANSGPSPSTSGSSFLLCASSYQGNYLGDNNVVPPIDISSMMFDFSITEEQFDNPIPMNEETGSDKPGEPLEHAIFSDHTSLTKRNFHVSDDDISAKIPTKKARASMPAPRRAKNSKSKKSQKCVSTDNDEETNAEFNGQSCSSYISDEDSNASQEMNGEENTSYNSSATQDLNANTTAGRGSATNPQSLYARKRRERINERLRILQNLVPNGNKVDISTMLEEAVQYVKFLQLQIKLLSSDELWMYAPIAYNGINIGLDLKMSPPQQ
ncbi:uncharacterized protein [Typha angustifolia]|uniref:uncharacterized protein n=1 Tax=Typha angustifolia TaxID=59011 RepID=UPI003C2B69B5